MSCPTAARLAAAASGEDPEAAEHAEHCAACGEQVAAERAIRAALAATPRRSWSPSRRAEVLASTLAIAERPAPRRWRPAMIGALGVAALAAAVVLAVRGVDDGAGRLSPPTLAVRAPAPPPAPTPATVVAAQLDAPPTTRLVRRAARADAPEQIELLDGALAIDATGPRSPVTLTAGATTIEVRQARVAITSRDGAIATVQVFAGSVEVQVGARRARVEVGEVWRAADVAVATPRPDVAVAAATPPRGPRPTAPARDDAPASDDDGFAAFRAGWVALRAGDARAARQAFDRVDEPEVAEDAAYWGAVASERLGEERDALARYRGFLAWFPRSPRAEAAQAAVTRLSASIDP